MSSNRRDFLKQFFVISGGITLAGGLSSFIQPEEEEKFDFKISLAQWSLHKAFFNKQIDPLDFPVVAKKKFGISGVEYVNQFFLDKAKDKTWLTELKKRCDDHDVKSLIIMIDLEGSLAEKDAAERAKAVENHYKWVEAAQFLGCHSIRVNLHGTGSAEEWKSGSIESLKKLSDFAKAYNINVIVENHGGYSSNGAMLAEVIRAVQNKNCGTLPDFGNFCMRREKGDLWESPCVDWYDRYKGVEEMLPFAKGISAKSFDFDANGNETTTDFKKMFDIIRKSKFKGYIGVEYEGNRLSEEQGIIATKALLERMR